MSKKKQNCIMSKHIPECINEQADFKLDFRTQRNSSFDPYRALRSS